MSARLHRLAAPLLFLALFALIVASNQLDWDQFLSFFEVDRRAWLIDHAPPLWSYQLCAGASRLGDPQAFGLSPLFLPVLLFGSFWGGKLLVLGCMIAGWLGLRAGLATVFPSLDAALRGALGLFFLFGNYLLWHLHAGHVTFALIPLSLVLLSLTARLFTGGFGWRQAALFAGVGAAMLSGGFYPVVAFFLVPVTICLLLPALALRLGVWPARRAWLRFTAALSSAFALSAYKWIGVLSYQRIHPRTLTADTHTPERAISILETLAYHLSPTWGHDFWLAPAHWGPWDVWEYAAFSGVSLLALGLAVRALLRRSTEPSPRRARVIALFAIGIVLCLGFTRHEDSAWSLHRLVNHAVYQGSARVIGRYAIVLQLILLLWVAWRLSIDAAARAWVSRWLLPIGYMACALNLAMLFRLVDWSATSTAISTERRTVAQMQVERFVRPRSTERPHAQPYHTPSSYMFAAIARGEIVPNCYQPLRRPRTVSTEARTFGVEVGEDDTIELVDPYPGPIEAPCRRSVWVTQQAISFDGAACPSDLCLNLNAVNLYADEAFALDEERGKYCRRR